MSSTQQGAALITGASSGIGAVYADRLARRGHDLVLVARNQERLEALAARLSAETGRRVDVVAVDLTGEAGLARVEAVIRERRDLAVLVNNAGFGSAAPLLAADARLMQEMIGVNVTALTRLTYAAAPKFVERGKGAVINIASIVAISPEVLNGVYGGTKAYVLAFSQSLQHELGDKGVRVQAVLPGATATAFWDVAGVPVSNLPEEWVMTVEDMVDAALAGLDQGEQVTIPALPDLAEWNAYDAARRAMSGRLSASSPAARYGVGHAG